MLKRTIFKRTTSLLLAVTIFSTSFYIDFSFMTKTVQAEGISDQQENLIRAASETEPFSSKKYSDLDALKELIATARLLANAVEKYPQSSRADLAEALDFIEPLVVDGMDDFLISMYTDAIHELIDALVPESQTGEVDKAELLKLIGIADELSSQDYTVDSWENVELLLGYAKEIYMSTQKVQELVNTIVAKLQDAIDGLVVDDLRALMTAIARETDFVSGNYTLASWYTAQIALYDAKAVLAKSNATAEEFAAAANALNTAFDNLVPKVNKVNLKAAIDVAVSYDTTLYTTLSVLKMRLALSDAQKINNGSGYTQAEVDAATLSLNNALGALVSQIIKTELKELITSTSAIASSNYTFVSWYNLRLAISDATAVANDGNATQAQVDEQVALLKAAEAALVPK